MSVTKRGKVYHLRIRPFGPELVTVRTIAETKTEAMRIERTILTACQSRDYRALDPTSRAVCVAMFRNRGWEMPADLGGEKAAVIKEWTLWKAMEAFLNYPGIQESRTRARYVYAFIPLVKKLGRDRPIKELWVPDLRAYQATRQSEKAAPATINWEMATLSKLFGVMVEMQAVEANPVRLIKRLSTKSGERQVYLSLHDVNLIADRCPEWYQLVIWTAYFTGMRRGEIVGLTRKQVNLGQRMITLSPHDTKEAHWKRVPIHRELIPYLREALRLPSLTSEKVFLVHDGQGTKELGKDTFKNPWSRACKTLEDAELLKKPFPHFHDLRHTWKTNARRSGMDPEIRESILGHWFKERSVSERHGRISNEELIRAIDSTIFDHGQTEILVVKQETERCAQNPFRQKESRAVTRLTLGNLWSGRLDLNQRPLRPEDMQRPNNSETMLRFP
ncbi:MAG: tyrosine-type recombinase/integrase [Desulfomonilaceae bacterium]